MSIRVLHADDRKIFRLGRHYTTLLCSKKGHPLPLFASRFDGGCWFYWLAIVRARRGLIRDLFFAFGTVYRCCNSALYMGCKRPSKPI